jgi:hypothetical protein
LGSTRISRKRSRSDFTEKWLKITSRAVAHYYFARNSEDARIAFLAGHGMNFLKASAERDRVYEKAICQAVLARWRLFFNLMHSLKQTALTEFTPCSSPEALDDARRPQAASDSDQASRIVRIVAQMLRRIGIGQGVPSNDRPDASVIKLRAMRAQAIPALQGRGVLRFRLKPFRGAGGIVVTMIAVAASSRPNRAVRPP